MLVCFTVFLPRSVAGSGNADQIDKNHWCMIRNTPKKMYNFKECTRSQSTCVKLNCRYQEHLLLIMAGIFFLLLNENHDIVMFCKHCEERYQWWWSWHLKTRAQPCRWSKKCASIAQFKLQYVRDAQSRAGRAYCSAVRSLLWESSYSRNFWRATNLNVRLWQILQLQNFCHSWQAWTHFTV